MHLRLSEDGNLGLRNSRYPTRNTIQLLGPSVSVSTSALEKRFHDSWKSLFSLRRSYLHLWRSLHSVSLYPRLWKSESGFQYISGQGKEQSDLQFQKSSLHLLHLFISIYVSGKVKSSLLVHVQESLSCLHINLWES